MGEGTEEPRLNRCMFACCAKRSLGYFGSLLIALDSLLGHSLESHQPSLPDRLPENPLWYVSSKVNLHRALNVDNGGRDGGEGYNEVLEGSCEWSVVVYRRVRGM